MVAIVGICISRKAIGVSGLGTTPELCTDANKGRCDCSSERGFQTYTFMSGANQRCFTMYVPETIVDANKKGSILLHADCYAKDQLDKLEMRQGSELIGAADKYSFAVIGLSTPTGKWQIGYDGIVNSTYPMQCSTDASIDIAYLESILKYVEDYSDDLNLNSAKFYASGFSQNSMFSAYAGYCFPNHVRGIWQGGSGLAMKDQRPFTHQIWRHNAVSLLSSGMIATAYSVNLAQHVNFGLYFPCYQATSPMVECLSSYDDDGVVHALGALSSNSTSMYMYKALVDEGHDARLFTFTADPANGIRGGHQDAKNKYSWINGCLGISPACSSECESSFASCVQGNTVRGVTKTWMVFRDCEERIHSLSGCAAGCAPTLEMLKLSEVPSTILLSDDIFGARNNSATSRVQPSSSKCVSSRTGYQIPAYGSDIALSFSPPALLTPSLSSSPSFPEGKGVFVQIDLVGEAAATFRRASQNRYKNSVSLIAEVPISAVKILSTRNIYIKTLQRGSRRWQSNTRVLQVDTRILAPPRRVLASSGEFLTSAYIFDAITNSVLNGSFVVELNRNGLRSVTMAGISSISLDGSASTTIFNTSLVTATGVSYPRI